MTQPDTPFMAPSGHGDDRTYTEDELRFLAALRASSGRTCRRCKWLSMRGQQRGCFPGGKYRKFLSDAEYGSGCEQFEPRQ